MGNARQRPALSSPLAFSNTLDRWGVYLRDLAWQTDNGSEFIGGHDLQGHRAGFPAALGDSQHLRIPPAAHTYQSDVETVHCLVKNEFFDLETFTSRGEFLAKAQIYQLYFNLARPNSHKEFQTPWQIIERLAPRSRLQLCLLPPVFLDYYLNDSGGYDVPSYPWEKNARDIEYGKIFQCHVSKHDNEQRLNRLGAIVCCSRGRPAIFNG